MFRPNDPPVRMRRSSWTGTATSMPAARISGRTVPSLGPRLRGLAGPRGDSRPLDHPSHPRPFARRPRSAPSLPGGPHEPARHTPCGFVRRFVSRNRLGLSRAWPQLWKSGASMRPREFSGEMLTCAGRPSWAFCFNEAPQIQHHCRSTSRKLLLVSWFQPECFDRVARCLRVRHGQW